jgi:hypothetical protein
MRSKLRKRYIESDYERLHTRLSEEVQCETELDNIVDVRTGCIFDTKTITSGPIREVEVFPLYLKKEMPDEWRRKETKEARKNLNDKNARKKFIRKLNANFNKDDYFLTLNYFKELRPKDHKEARKHMRNFIQTLNRKYEKEQLKNGVTKSKLKKIKYMFVTEYSEDKKIECHHHLVMNAVLPITVVKKAWKFGSRGKMDYLDPDDMHFTGLGNYLSKDPKGKKRWCCSKNLKDPDITRNLSKFSKKKVKEMKDNQNLIKFEMEKANPGYIFVKSEVYINTYNGMPYIYATMRRID